MKEKVLSLLKTNPQALEGLKKTYDIGILLGIFEVGTDPSNNSVQMKIEDLERAIDGLVRSRILVKSEMKGGTMLYGKLYFNLRLSGD